MKIFKHLIIVTAICYCHSALADMATAKKYYDVGERNLALTEYLKEAEAGNTEAFYWIGHLYDKGTVTIQDPKKAAHWYTRAAEEHGMFGDARAQYLLGQIYEEGNGVEIRYLTAAKFYAMAAAQKYEDAAYHAGNLYFKGGMGFKPEPDTAIMWWEQAATSGHIESYYQLAQFYNHHEERQDLSLALTWYKRAADKGHLKSQHQLAMMYHQGRGTEVDLEKTIYWLETAAEGDHLPAINSLGTFYTNGIGGKIDYDRAISYYERAARLGYADSQRYLALILYQEDYAGRDLVRAAAWMIRAAENRNSQARREAPALLNMLDINDREAAEQLAASDDL